MNSALIFIEARENLLRENDLGSDENSSVLRFITFTPLHCVLYANHFLVEQSIDVYSSLDKYDYTHITKKTEKFTESFPL